MAIEWEGEISESVVLYLADKLCIDDRPVSLEERFIKKTKDFSGNKAAQNAVLERFNEAKAIKQKIGAVLGYELTVEKLFRYEEELT